MRSGDKCFTQSSNLIRVYPIQRTSTYLERFKCFSLQFQHTSDDNRFVRRDLAGCHSGDQRIERSNEVAGSSNLRQDERDGASFRSRRHAFEYELSRRHVALLGRVDHRAHHVLDIVLHQLLGQHGGTVTGAPGPTSRVAGLPGLELSAGSYWRARLQGHGQISARRTGLQPGPCAVLPQTALKKLTDQRLAYQSRNPIRA